MCSSRVSEVVVITGASAGVGRATAQGFRPSRSTNWFTGARPGWARKCQAGCRGGRRPRLIVPTDVSDWEQVEAAAEAVEREFGPIDVWVNDAMCSVFSPVKEMTAADYRRVTEVTYLGYVHGTLSALKRMLPRDRGSIVQVGSALAYRGIPLQSAYCAAKHAIQGFNDSLRAELLHDRSRVRVTMVQMPALNTPQFNWVKSRLPRKAAARSADLSAGGRGRGDCVGRPPRPPRMVCRRVDAVCDRGQQARTGPGRLVSGPARFRQSAIRRTRRPHRKNNLNEPVDADVDFGAHGDFDAPRPPRMPASSHQPPSQLARRARPSAAPAAAHCCTAFGSPFGAEQLVYVRERPAP